MDKIYKFYCNDNRKLEISLKLNMDIQGKDKGKYYSVDSEEKE